MNLIELFNSLSFPKDGNENIFNAVVIPGYLSYRIAINSECNPVLLLPTIIEDDNYTFKNYRLKYLKFEQNVECKVKENDKVDFQTFSTLTFTSSDTNLQEYFLRISETLIKTLIDKPTRNEIIETLKRFIEVFRSLNDPPTNTIKGLWAELFLISNSKSPDILLNYWHAKPEEKFDFNSGKEIIEVKSTSSFERIHTFSADQLNPNGNVQLIIASLFVRHHSNGRSIQQLVENITVKIQDDRELIEKLNYIVIKTLGNTFEESIKAKFDYQIAKESLSFYKYEDISRIAAINIPLGVTDVQYKSDLTKIKSTPLYKISDKRDCSR